MLQKNIIEGIKKALDCAGTSDYSELEERLNICKMLLGTYTPDEADFIQFRNASAEDFEGFYKRYLYRKDSLVPDGSGVVLSLNRILDSLDDLRKRLNINQKELDNIKDGINIRQKQIESFIDLKYAIERNNTELLRLNEQKNNFDMDAQEYEKLKKQIDELEALIRAKQEALSGKSLDELKRRISELKTDLNNGLDINAAEEIIKQCSGIGLLSKVNIDLFCEYVEDEKISGRLKESGLIEAGKLKEIKKFEAQLNVVFKEYLEYLRLIIKDLPVRKETVS